MSGTDQHMNMSETDLENSIEFSRKHHITLSLQLSGHECLLAIELSRWQEKISGRSG